MFQVVPANRPNKENDNDNFGFWAVEAINMGADCNDSQFLGIYRGNVIDIAFAIAKKYQHTLRFTKIVIPVINSKYDYGCPNRESINIQLSHTINKGFTTSHELAEYFKTYFSASRDNDKNIDTIEIEDSTQYNCTRVILYYNDKETKIRKQALSKLTEEEKKILGLI